MPSDNLLPVYSRVWADTTYHRNPKSAVKVVKKLEAEPLRYMKANAANTK
jgi:hypothetical protein